MNLRLPSPVAIYWPDLAVGLALVLFLSSPARGQEELLLGIPTQDPNVVLSPYVDDCQIDISGVLPGDTAIDPHSSRKFIVPVLGQFRDAKKQQSDAQGENSNDDDETGVGAGADGSVDPRDLELPEKMATFINHFLDARGGNDPAASVQFLATPVDYYFGKTDLGIEDLVATRIRRLGRWPDRAFTQRSAPLVVGREFDTYSVILDLEYAIRNDRSEITGTERLLLRIMEVETGYEIVHVEDTAL